MGQLWGLSDMDEGVFDATKIGEYYRAWMNSNPFDMGHTTRQGLGFLKHYQ